MKTIHPKRKESKTILSIETGLPECVCLESDLRQVEAERDELIDLCKDLLLDSMNHYDLYPNSHRKTAEEYFNSEIKALEKITGLSWEEIKESEGC